MATQKPAASQDLNNLKEYEHEALPSPEYLRILQIFPARRGNPTISCKLPVALGTPKDVKAAVQPEHAKASAPADFTGTKEQFQPFLLPNGYEALPWCWGGIGSDDQSITILDENDDAKHWKVYNHLYDALLALRHVETSRFLWIDAVCIDQSNIPERNQQVSKMSEIYGDAQNVCVWLGTASLESRMAINFIKEIVLQVYSFDELLQEVSLAKKATVHCGPEYIDWQDFAAAVSLFVDVDDSARKLSQLAQKEEQFQNAQDFFREVPALGATMLVNTTNRLFKKSVGGVPQRTGTLEEIVARLAPFHTSEPRDTIYALLALAKDSQASVGGIPDRLYGKLLTDRQKKALQAVTDLLPNPYRQRYNVDYRQEIVDVYQQFIAFAISKANPSRALDIIFRPFAQPYTYEEDVNFDKDRQSALENPTSFVPLPTWIPNVNEVPFAKQERHKNGRNLGQGEIWKMERQRGDLFVSTYDTASYSAAGARTYNKDKVRFRKRSEDSYSMFVEGFILDTVAEVEAASQSGIIPAGWLDQRDRYEAKDPDIFWKVLVADRSPRGNAPLFYKNVIREALKFAKAGNSFDMRKQVGREASETISQVLRQVEATIWGRCLVGTKRELLGLAPSRTKRGDIVCILYGCSVPVILRRVDKSAEDVLKEKKEDEADKEKRLQKLKPLLAEFFARKRRTRSGASANLPPQTLAKAPSISSGGDDTIRAKGAGHESAAQPTSKQYAHAWLVALTCQPVLARLLLLSITVTALSLVANEQLAAGLLSLLAVPHIHVDLSSSDSNRRQHEKLSLLAIVVVVATTTTLLHVVYKGFHYAALLVVGFEASFPEVLPPTIRRDYQDFLASLKFSAKTSDAVGVPPLPVASTVTGQHITDKPASIGACSGEAPSGSKGHHADGAKQRSKKPAITLKPRRQPTRDEQLDHYYEVIGECYIHNMMNGEAIQWQNDSILESTNDRMPPKILELR
ncbi:hypothetical protein LTR08_005131 [Meristemomyces frigidus]|nr:hypothetical protein LTR08_005131 [Meristemomyces frigidus]